MKLKKPFFVLALAFSLFFVDQTTAQDDTITTKNMVSFGVLGTSSYIGATYERLLTDNVAVEAGVGLLSVGFGATYYPWKIKEDDVSFYTGAKYSSPNIISFAFLIPDETDSVLYIPIGFTYATSGGFNLGLDVGPSLTGSSSVWGNIKLGFRF